MPDDRRDGARTLTQTSDGLADRGGASSWTLVVVGKGTLRTLQLPAAGSVVIGRDAACEVVLDHDRVSRRHARLQLGEPCTIEDLGSHNGTELAGTALVASRPRELNPGDSIKLGPFALVLMHAGSPAHTTPAASLAIDDPTGASASTVLASIARSDLSVLVRGETGSGKEVLAQTIHRLSARDGQLLCLNCAAIGSELLESELFGHERGAFTGATAAKAGLLEVAAGGTVLLDEIGDMPVDLQAKLLRAVETREVRRVGATRPTPIDVRFLSATHKDLFAEIERGTFRLDLYYRLAGVTLEIPPLRMRRSHIVGIANALLAARGGPIALSTSAVAKLEAHAWPGNVRELRNVLDRARVLAEGGPIDAPHVVFDQGSPPGSAADPDPPEKRRIVDALAQCDGSQTRAAKLLGISRSTLATKLAIYRIPRPRD